MVKILQNLQIVLSHSVSVVYNSKYLNYELYNDFGYRDVRASTCSLKCL